MILLTIILALAILYYRAPLLSLQSDSWFSTWLIRVSSCSAVAKIPAGRLLLALGLPAVGLWLLVDLLAAMPVFFLLAVELTVLLYSFGRGDLRTELKTLQADLRRGDIQTAFHSAEMLSADKHKIVAFALPGFAQELRQRIAYAYFERYLAVVFWALMGGVTGALLYRLSVLYRSSLVSSVSQSVAGDASFAGYLQLRTASRWLALLEWLPLGLAGFTLALVGQFGAGLARWLTRWCSGRSSVRILRDYTEDALGYPGGSDTAATDIAVSCAQIEVLFKRVLIVWLCLLALWHIL